MRKFLLSIMMILAAAVSLSAQDASQNPKEINKERHYSSIFDMFRSEPGIIVQGGDNPRILVRGISTNTDNTDPLFVVDGLIIPAANVGTIMPENVYSIEVIKDATAAIYGLQGGNGVILITTVSAHDKAEREAMAQKEAKLAEKAAKAQAKADKKAQKKNK